jgi:hypothetical protein
MFDVFIRDRKADRERAIGRGGFWEVIPVHDDLSLCGKGTPATLSLWRGMMERRADRRNWGEATILPLASARIASYLVCG